MDEKFFGAPEERINVQTLPGEQYKSSEWNAGEGIRTEKDDIWLNGIKGKVWMFDLLSNCRDPRGLYSSSHYYLWRGYVVTKEEQVLDLSDSIRILPAFIRFGEKLKSVEKDGNNSVFSFMLPQRDYDGRTYSYDGGKIYIQRLKNRDPSEKYTYVDHQRIISVSLN